VCRINISQILEVSQVNVLVCGTTSLLAGFNGLPWHTFVEKLMTEHFRTRPLISSESYIQGINSKKESINRWKLLKRIHKSTTPATDKHRSLQCGTIFSKQAVSEDSSLFRILPWGMPLYGS
jgi:hypothetical protein